MANGFAPYLLKSIAEIAKENNPEYTLDPAGYFNLLLSQGSADVVSNGPTQNGHLREVRVKSLQRAIVAQTDTTASCDNVNVPAYNEATVPLDIYRQIGIYIDDITIARYESEASASILVGQPPTKFMREFVKNIMTHTDAIVQGLDQDLLTKQLAAVGVNTNTGNNAAKAINIPKSTLTNPLDDSITEILYDYQTNGFRGKPQVVGSGLIQKWFIQQAYKFVDQSGIDSRIQASMMNFFPDLNFGTIFGADQALLVAPNTVQLVEWMFNQGSFAGNKGVSQFGVMTLPMQVGFDVLPVNFDFQLKYIDCPTSLIDAYSGATITAARGYALIISKNVGLYTLPTNAYQAGDRLAGVRGTLRYALTNECDVCA